MGWKWLNFHLLRWKLHQLLGNWKTESVFIPLQLEERAVPTRRERGESPRTQEQWWLFLLFVTVLHAPFYLSIWLSDQSFYLPFLPFSPCFPCAVTASLCSRSLVDRGCSHCHAVGAAQGHGQAVVSCTSSLGRSNSSLSLPRERRMNHPLGFYRCGFVFLFC